MKTEHGMGTLMTIFSGVAALMCVLVGIQLFFLESQIGRATTMEPVGSAHNFRLWQAEAHTGAIMSLGAGVLILLFGIRNHTAGSPKRNRRMWEDYSDPTPPESLSVRIFEVDDQDRSVEVESFEDFPADGGSLYPVGAWKENLDLETDEKPTGDPADSILRSIDAAVGPESPRSSKAAGETRESFMKRLRRLGRRRR